MIRVLHSVSNMDRGGIETMLMNYYRHTDREKVQFDFIVNKPKPGDYDDEIRRLGGNIYLSPGLNPIKYREYLKFTKNIFDSNPDIKILHAHNEAMGLYAVNGAKKSDIKVRIAHAHNTRIERDYKWPLKIFCKRFLAASATELWSCGRDAGIYFFGKKNWEQRGMIMRNAVETENFAFSRAVRENIRKKYNLEGKTVIGHVGRFNIQKNHKRLLDIFREYLNMNADAVLMLIGEGQLEDDIKKRAQELGISEKTLFMGIRSDVGELYQAMDLFLMPSLYEGMPVVGVEAQAAGLPCVFSEEITDEVILSKRSRRIPLANDNIAWAKTIYNLLECKTDRYAWAEIVKKAGYDIKTEAKRIENIYIKLSEGE